MLCIALSKWALPATPFSVLVGLDLFIQEKLVDSVSWPFGSLRVRAPYWLPVGIAIVDACFVRRSPLNLVCDVCDYPMKF